MSTKISCFKSHTASSVPSPSWAYPLLRLPFTLTMARIYELLILGLHSGDPCKAWLESPGTDVFSSLQLLTQSTGRSFPDSQIPLTHKLASNAKSALTAWKPLAERRVHTPCPSLSKGQSISPIPGWMCWLPVEPHGASIHLCWVLDWTAVTKEDFTDLLL